MKFGWSVLHERLAVVFISANTPNLGLNVCGLRVRKATQIRNPYNQVPHPVIHLHFRSYESWDSLFPISLSPICKLMSPKHYF